MICLLNHVTERKLEGRKRRGKRRRQLPDDLQEKIRYWKLKEESSDCTLCTARFGRSHGRVARQTSYCMPVQASSEYLPDHGPVYSSTSASLLHSPLYHPTTREVIRFFWNTIVWSYLITSRVTNFKMLNDILSHLYGPSAAQYNSNILCCGKLCGVGWRIANKITTQYCSLLQNMNQTQAQFSWLFSWLYCASMISTN